MTAFFVRKEEPVSSQFSAYMGRILDVDLSTGLIGEYPVSDRDREQFLGGRFLAARILWDALKPGIDALSPENVLVVTTSPLTGSGAPSSSRYNISAKSPQTGSIGHSNSGGSFGIHLKRAGYDGVVVRGRAKKPVYLDITENGVAIKDASKIWGKDTQAAQEAIMEESGRGGTMAIGIAGENLVPFATVVSQERSHGRTGMGAVMGSKNLKGMAAHGKLKVSIAEPEKFSAVVKDWMSLIKGHPATGDLVPKYGTAYFVNVLSKKNALPTYNFRQGSFEGAEKISGERLADEFMTKNFGCVTCPIRCGRQVEIDGKPVKGPEFEILCLMGSNLGVSDLPAIIKWNRDLDLLGMDSISTGNVLGFACELNEKGMWDNGLKFGDVEAFDKMLPLMAKREGVGADLSLGTRELSRKYGGADFAAQVKGLEIPAYEPRAAAGHALGYAVSGRGACHLDGGYMIYFEISGPLTLDPLHFRSKPGWVVLDQNLLAAIGAGGNCLFTSWTALPAPVFKLPPHKRLSKAVAHAMTAVWPAIDYTLSLPPFMMPIDLPMLPHTKALRLATGMKMNLGRFLEVGNRGHTLERMLNLREGVGMEADTLPKRFLTEELVPGDKKTVVQLPKMRAKYYKLRGWDENGIPTQKTLKKLGLEFAMK